MPAMNRTLTLTIITKPFTHLHLHNRTISSTPAVLANYGHSGFSNQTGSFSATYEPGQPTKGPLGGASPTGVPRLTPILLKEHLDKYVVGQDKAKKVTSVAIYNHYQRIRELRRREDEARERKEQRDRWEMVERERNSHPVENEYPGHIETVDLNSSPPKSIPLPDFDFQTPHENATTIEKSNLLLLGPSGVGKTYILSTLARTLSVPFTTIDCSALTQAGYIGTDIESSIERLLLAANHNIQKCETGIIFFDEVDKLAKPAIMTHGRDVSGEGVQQGLLKMIEGTTVTVNAKQDRSSRGEKERNERLERGQRDSSGKGEQFTIDTTNILFVFAGAFIGLEKIISSRLASGSSIGFGATIKSLPPPSNLLPTPTSKTKLSSSPTITPSKLKPRPNHPTPPSILHHVTPSDLQTYGLIPELLGRIPILTSLSPLSLPQLISILTEPRNSLIKQYTALFKTYSIDLRFTTGALHAVAERALASPQRPSSSSHITTGGIGARGLRGILENVLAEVMFRGPGSGIRYCLVDEAFVRANTNSKMNHASTTVIANGADGEEEMPRCWSRGQSRAFEDMYEVEEERWRRENEEGYDGDLAEKEKEKQKESRREKQRDGMSFQGMRRVGGSGM